MSDLKSKIETIIKELTKLQTVPPTYRDKDDDFPFPRMISAGNGGSIIVSRKIDDEITEVANVLRVNDSSLASKVTDAEWHSSVRNAFGPALTMINLDFDSAKNADDVLTKIKANLAEVVLHFDSRELGFGCTLFGNSKIKPFHIGPVCFEPRLDWLNRKRKNNEISATTHRHIEKLWSGKRVRGRKQSVDSILERDILDSINTCPFVCSVTLTGLAVEAGREKGLTAARLAITAIALLWQSPSRALEGMNLLFDRHIHRQKALTFVPGKTVLAGSRLSHMPHGPWLKDGEWESELAENKAYFCVVGDILNYMIDATGNASRPHMMNTLGQALLWFHEACRDSNNLMTIVKYSAALDALAGGRKAKGIRDLIHARLGIAETDSIRTNGPTLKQAVDQIYSDGRSRTIHGSNFKLGHDWSGTRGLAEQFARLCLSACIDWAATNSLCDDPEQLRK